jgi:hypothetical protein
MKKMRILGAFAVGALLAWTSLTCSLAVGAEANVVEEYAYQTDGMWEPLWVENLAENETQNETGRSADVEEVFPGIEYDLNEYGFLNVGPIDVMNENQLYTVLVGLYYIENENIASLTVKDNKTVVEEFSLMYVFPPGNRWAHINMPLTGPYRVKMLAYAQGYTDGILTMHEYCDIS